jgi:hypothetical protein
MRKISALLLAGATAVAVTGCDSFLTPDPQTFSSSANYYTQPGQFEQAVVGLYGDLRGLFGGNWRTLGGLRSDVVTLQYNPGVPGFTFVLDEFAEDANDNNIQNQWNDLFNTIFDANVVLTRIDKVDFPDPAEKAKLIAEAKYIRALAMWEGLQFWGMGESWDGTHLAIPIITAEITDPSDAFNLERATAQQVYDFIVNDLSSSWKDLPAPGSAAASGANAGRITQGAARTLLGATYQLNPADAGKALAEFQAVDAMNHYKLIPDYRQVFNPANKNNAESILEIQYNVALDNGGLRQNLVPDMSPLNALGGGNGGSAQRIAVYGGSGNGSYMPTPDYILSFAGADPSKPETPFDKRYTGGIGEFCPGSVSGVLGVRDTLVANQGANTLWPDINVAAVRDPQTHEVRSNCIAYFTKWRWPESMTQSGRDDNNWIVFRYADVLLREAEAYWRLNQPAQALIPLNAVRNRAGLPPLSGLSGDALRDAILQERAWELGGEGWRWFDLKRFGVATQRMEAQGDFLRDRNNSVSPHTRTLSNDSYKMGTQGFRLWYPIRPRDVVLSQGKLQQNFGW